MKPCLYVHKRSLLKGRPLALVRALCRQRPTDSCGTAQAGLNNQAVERCDETDVETAQAVVAMNDS